MKSLLKSFILFCIFFGLPNLIMFILEFLSYESITYMPILFQDYDSYLFFEGV